MKRKSPIGWIVASVVVFIAGIVRGVAPNMVGQPFDVGSFFAFSFMAAIAFIIGIVRLLSKNKKNSVSAEQNKIEGYYWDFLVKANSGKWVQKTLAVSKEAYHKIKKLHNDDIPLNGSIELEPVLEKIKAKLSEEMKTEVDVEFLDTNYQ